MRAKAIFSSNSVMREVMRSKRDALVIKVFADIARISHVAQVVFVVATARFQDGIQILIENRWIVVQRLIKGRGKLVVGCLISELFVDLDLGKALIQFQNDHSSSFHF